MKEIPPVIAADEVVKATHALSAALIAVVTAEIAGIKLVVSIMTDVIVIALKASSVEVVPLIMPVKAIDIEPKAAPKAEPKAADCCLAISSVLERVLIPWAAELILLVVF